MNRETKLDLTDFSRVTALEKYLAKSRSLYSLRAARKFEPVPCSRGAVYMLSMVLVLRHQPIEVGKLPCIGELVNGLPQEARCQRVGESRRVQRR